jgi:hypothetical protein
MYLLGRGHNLIQVADDGIAFHLGDTNNLGNEVWVKEETLPAHDGVRANEWMCSRDRITADPRPAAIEPSGCIFKECRAVSDQIYRAWELRVVICGILRGP